MGSKGGMKVRQDVKEKSSNIRANETRESDRLMRRAMDTKEEATNNLRNQLGKFSFGRVGEEKSADMQNVLGQRRQLYDQGFGAKAHQAAREQRLRGLGSENLSGQRSLLAQQARSGVAGGAAGQQLSGLLAQQQASRQQAEQDLFLQEAQAKERALGGLESSITQSEADQLGRQQFNIGLGGREAMIRAQPDLLAAGMGSADVSGLQQIQQATLMQRQAQKPGGGK